MAAGTHSRWVVLDAMGVIFVEADDHDNLLVPFVQQRNPEMGRQRIVDAYFLASRGAISPRRFWSTMALEDAYPRVQDAYLRVGPQPDPTFDAAAARLRARYRLAICSNDVAAWGRRLRVIYDLNRWFDGVVISSDVHARKPDPRIFRVLHQRLQAPPSACVFVDDQEPNVRAAAAAGFRTIRFRRDTATEPSAADAVAYGFTDLPGIVERVLPPV